MTIDCLTLKTHQQVKPSAPHSPLELLVVQELEKHGFRKRWLELRHLFLYFIKTGLRDTIIQLSQMSQTMWPAPLIVMNWNLSKVTA